ncbi:hypothetical protein SASPL_107707 [Salvia splendens]|uniref:Glutathione S-transferase n=1 Tax=Salvia splendens TaxID=180675 RepID=A0A8X8YCX5_SALSN|nr:hypothetical protein SASPL_107707 [Salvia splendens]
MTTSSVKLYGGQHSPYVNRVVMALEVKSVDYELVETNPRELLIKINPIHKKIPVHVHGDRPICESLIIVQYIDDAWTNGHSILPTDPYDRATAQFWAAFVDDEFVPLLRKIGRPKGKRRKCWFSRKCLKHVCCLRMHSSPAAKAKLFFGGDNVGYLDIALGCFVGHLWLSEMMNPTYKILDETKTPCLAGWAERLYSDSLVKDVMPSFKNFSKSIRQCQKLFLIE